MGKLKFTIVIPVHNGMPFIKECVESALKQTYKHYNIIILENCSDDGTAEYLDTINSDKITIIKSDKLLSIEENWARIKDLEMNEYMSILMADDVLCENYLQEIIGAIINNPDCNSFRTNINLINEKSEVIYSSNIKDKITIYEYLGGRLKHTYTETACGYTFKTSRYKEIGGIDCRYRLMHTDDKLFMEAMGQNNYMAVSPNHSANYRCHTGSESGSPNAEAELGGFNLWLNWIYSLNDEKLNQIVRDYLPYHINQIKRFFTPEVIEKHKEIYKLFGIDENDKHHKKIMSELTQNKEGNKKNKFRFKDLIKLIFSVRNDKRGDGTKRKIITILGIKLSFKSKRKAEGNNKNGN